MRRLVHIPLLLLFVSASVIGTAQQQNQATVASSLAYMWKDVKQDFIALAESMPEDKWSFKPTEGAFSGARTFAEQIKHVACANEAWAKKLRQEEPPHRCDTGGPNPAKTKAELMRYLRDSFAALDAGIAATNTENLLSTLRGPYAGDNRLEVVTSALWHVSDHYGQLVEYLRLNGIVPPGSR